MMWWLVPGPFAGVGPRGYRRPDERIQEDLCERLSRHGQIDASDVEVRVAGGEVTLTGSVTGRDAKRMAEDLAESVSGVKQVHNRLRVTQGMVGQTGEQTTMGTGRETGPRQRAA